MSSSTIPLSSIPTISSLYKDSTLQSASPDPSLPPPSSSLNEKISLIRTSITDLGVTCIVNAANESLLGGGGVDGAIHRAAGRSLLAECRALNGCETGSARMTTGHALPASYIIHAVGPVYASAKRKSATLPAELLAGCYEKSLELAAEKGGSIAFSCLSTGIYGYPSGEAAEVALRVVRDWLVKEEEEDNERIERVVFCCFESKDEKAYKALIPYEEPMALSATVQQRLIFTRKFFPPSRSDLPSSASPKEATPATIPSSTSAPLDTQASSLLAAAEKSANNEAPTTKKLKVTNPDVETEGWETVEKPEDFLEIEDAAETDIARSEAIASKSAAEAVPETVEEKPMLEASEGGVSEAGVGGSSGENSLLKDW